MTQPVAKDIAEAKKVESCETSVASQPADRETYITSLKDKIQKIQTKSIAMKEEIGRLAGDLKTKAEENLSKLDSKYKELKNRVEGFHFTTDEKWNSDKVALEKTCEELSTAYPGLFA